MLRLTRAWYITMKKLRSRVRSLGTYVFDGEICRKNQNSEEKCAQEDLLHTCLQDQLQGVNEKCLEQLGKEFLS